MIEVNNPTHLRKENGILRGKIVSCIMLTLTLTCILSLAFHIQLVKAGGIIYIRPDGSVDPDDGRIISEDLVHYYFTQDIYDSIVVEKDDIVVDGADHTLEGSGSATGIRLLSGGSNVTIKNTEIKSFKYGIYLYNSSKNNISGNNIENNKYGVYLVRSDNNSVNGNNVANNQYALYLGSSDKNSVNRNCVANNEYGIRLYLSNNNDLYENIMNDNKRNLYVLRASDLRSYLNSIDASNLANGKPVYYFINQTDLVINPTTHPQVGYLGLINCVNITVKGLAVADNGQGILLAFTTHSRIINNTVTNNENGISMFSSSNNIVLRNNMTRNYDDGFELDYFSSNNTFSENSITYNSGEGGNWWHSSNNTFLGNNLINNGYGLYLVNCSKNKFYHNNFDNNTQHVCIQYSQGQIFRANEWDNGVEGNYWSNYTGADSNHNGIGDTPHVFDQNNQDNYPLMHPWGSPAGSVYVLIRNIKSMGLEDRVEDRLVDLLVDAVEFLEKNREIPALTTMFRFAHRVYKFQLFGLLREEQADRLTTGAREIIHLIWSEVKWKRPLP